MIKNAKNTVPRTCSKNAVIKKDVYHAKIKDIEDKISTNTTLNARINQVKNKTPNINNLATTTALTAVESKTPDRRKYITTPKFNKFTAENFAARLAQANLGSKIDIYNFVKKTDFDDKLKKINKKLLEIKQKVYMLKMN